MSHNEERDPKILALAAHLSVSPDTVSECVGYGANMYESTEGPGEYLVLTDSEADAEADERLESYIDDCLELSEPLASYFDRDRWKRDALRSDGRGHTISSYDSEEAEQKIGDEWFYIYRMN